MITTASRWLGIACLLRAVDLVCAAPVITSFDPIAGAPGDQVQLTGSGFTSGNLTVRFWNGSNGVMAKIVYLNSDTAMTVAVPNGISTGAISLQQGTGTPFYSQNDFLAIGFGPFITGFSPEFGEVGDAVSIAGVHLGNAKAVLFNGTNAGFWPNAAGTQLTTSVPLGARTGPITVTTPDGSGNSPSSFLVIGPEPYITDFLPRSGNSGTRLQITGLHFTGATKVTFNGQPGVNLAANSDVLLQVDAPPGVTTGPIGVVTPKGSNFTTAYFYAAPAVAGFRPGSGRANTNVAVSGLNFLGATTVSFGGIASTNFSILNNSNLTALVPPGATSGLVRVVAPGGSAFSTTNFIIQPTLSGFSPVFGPVGTAVTITGANLNAGTAAVRFNGVLAAAPTGVTFNQLSAKVPPGATTGPISLTTVDGSDTNRSLFFLPATIAGLSATNSVPGSRITLTGQNFLGATAVSFNGTAAADFTVSNNTTLGVTVPDGVVTGPVSLTTPAGTVSSTRTFYGAPRIAGFAPAHGLPGDKVTINGLNFLGGTVLFKGISAAPVSLNNTQVVVTVPNNAQTGPLTVQGPAGAGTSTTNFVLDYASDLRVSISGSANPLTLGRDLVYTITLVNAGPRAAPQAVFTNQLPPTAVLRSASIAPPWLLTTNGHQLVGTANSLPTSSTVLTLTVTPEAVGNITNTLWFFSDNLEPAPADNTASLTTTIEPVARLSIGLATDHVQLSWPAALSNFVLQYQDQFSSRPHWAPVTTAPVVSADRRVVTEATNGAGRAYRLRR